jgi:acylphosphatase
VTHTVHLVVRGRVQGVGFRYFVRRRADSMGITGWVRNRADGAVEVEAEGARPELERLVAALSRGPAGAQVTAVEQEWSERVPCHHGFRVTD